MVPTIGFEPMTYALRVRCTTTVLSRHIDYPLRIVFFSKIIKQQFVADNMRSVAAKNTTFDCLYQFAIESVNDLHH